MGRNPLSKTVARLQKDNQRLLEKLNKAKVIIAVQNIFLRYWAYPPLKEGDL